MKRHDKKEMIREQHPVRDASLGRKKKNRPFSTDRCNPDGLRNALYPAPAHAQRYENVTKTLRITKRLTGQKDWISTIMKHGSMTR